MQADACSRCQLGEVRGVALPVSVETGSSATADDSVKAYNQLTAMAEAMRIKSPALSISQCFARVFEDSKNAELAAKAHRRPSATTSYAMP
jgi:hypothetical protein